MAMESFDKLNAASAKNEKAPGKKEDEQSGLVISVMLAVANAPEALTWYKKALGATVLWNFGSVVGLEVMGAAFFLGEPEKNGWECPSRLGTTSARIEVL